MSGISPLSHKFYVMHHLGGELLVVVKDYCRGEFAIIGF